MNVEVASTWSSGDGCTDSGLNWHHSTHSRDSGWRWGRWDSDWRTANTRDQRSWGRWQESDQTAWGERGWGSSYGSWKATPAYDLDGRGALSMEQHCPFSSWSSSKVAWHDLGGDHKEEHGVHGWYTCGSTSRLSISEVEATREALPLVLLGESVADTSWKYVVHDEQHRCFAGLLKHALAADKQDDFFTRVQEEVPWIRQDESTPRQTAWVVKLPCLCMYSYGGEAVKPSPWPAWMDELMALIMPKCGLTESGSWPNSCNINFYKDGNQSLGWHADDESLFRGWWQDCTIISLSLGSSRAFELYGPDVAEEEHGQTFTMDLQGGDICSMEGLFQKYYKHRVPAIEDACGPRINLTWRWIVQHTDNCPLRSSDLGPE